MSAPISIPAAAIGMLAVGAAGGAAAAQVDSDAKGCKEKAKEEEKPKPPPEPARVVLEQAAEAIGNVETTQPRGAAAKSTSKKPATSLVHRSVTKAMWSGWASYASYVSRSANSIETPCR